jgi:predicted transcriptional regulator
MHGTMKTVSFKVPVELDKALTELARRRKSSRSAVVREAIEAATRGEKRSVTELAGDLVGSLEGPGDLSTNPKYMEGFGE